MRLRFTVTTSETVLTPVDVEVEVARGTALGTIGEHLATALGSGGRFRNDPRGIPVHVRGQQVSPTHPLGLPPLVQGATLVLGGLPAPPQPVAGLAEIHVVAGPDAGLTHPVPPNRPIVVGRSDAADMTLADPLASRQHAEFSTSDGVVQIRDLTSANGTRAAGNRIGAVGVPLPPGTPVRIGRSTLTVRGPDRPPAAATPDGQGHLRVNRRWPLAGPRPAATIEMPSLPPRPSRPHLPWLMVLAPLLLAVPLALLWRQPGYLLIAAMSPILMLGQHQADRRRGGKEGRRLAATYEAQRLAAEQAVQQAVSADAQYLENTYPDLARLAVTARIPTDELWQRTPDHPAALAVRLGRGGEPARVGVRNPAAGAPTGDTRPRHADVPVVLELLVHRVIGISGPRTAVLGTARTVLGQLAVLHSPIDLGITLLQTGVRAPEDGPGEWDWLTWLPHSHPAPGPGRPDPPDGVPGLRVLVLDGAHRLRHRPEVADALARARSGSRPPESDHPHAATSSGTVVICLEQDEPALPLECTATVTHSAQAPAAILRRAGQPPKQFRPDLAGPRWAERLARNLAPLRDATPTGRSGIPDSDRLIDLLRRAGPADPLDPASLARAWRSGAPATGAVLGVSSAGPVTVDLPSDGPHGLVGGTTGSGKSELLQTLITSLAAGSGPDRLTLLLVDYKGGAAFQACSGLPQVGAVLTDLDPQSGRRALLSFAAELRRRERLLRQAGAVDIVSYTAARAGPAPLEPMPRLVVIVDEFRVLAEELPEFVTGLIRIATVGRSLGVHLVLATQRPAGVVSPDIAANVNLRIALRVRDAADSRDLIAGPEAAGLPAVPGRALLRIGTGPAVEFQTARVSGRTPVDAEVAAPVVRVLRPAGVVPDRGPTAGEQPPAVHPSDLERVVTAARAAAVLLKLPPARAPWLPELPARLQLDDLGGLSTPRLLPFGLADRPEEQRQEITAWDVAAGHLAVVGGARSGRSTVLRTLCSAADRVPVSAPVSVQESGAPPVHRYLLDTSGRLGDLERTGLARAVVGLDDHERAGRLLRRLVRELHDRTASSAGASIILLVDGWEALLSAWSEPGHTHLLDDLLTLLRDGPGSSIGLAVTAGVPLLTGQFSSMFGQRLVLRLPDPADAMVVGVPSGLARNTGPPGRGVWLSLGENGFGLVQVARALSSPGRPGHPAHHGQAGQQDQAGHHDQAGQVGQVGHHGQGQQDQLSRQGHQHGQTDRERRPGQRAWPDDDWAVPPLPREVSRAELPRPAAHRRPRLVVPIGIGGEQAQPVGLDLAAAPVTLILGARGSGRTTTLLSLAEGLTDGGVRTIVLRGRDARQPGVAADLAARLARHPESVVLLDVPLTPDLNEPATDDLAGVLSGHLAGHPTGHLTGNPAGLLSGHPTEHRTGAAGAARAAGPGHLVLTASAADIAGAYRGALTLARDARQGLVLGAVSPADGDVFGVRLHRLSAGPPGRGLLITAGQVVSVQVARPIRPADPLG